MKTIYFELFLATMLLATACGTPTHHTVGQAEAQKMALDTTFASALDSLEYVVNNVEMSVYERMCILDGLSFDLTGNDLEKSIYYANMGLGLAIKEKNDSLAGSFYRNLGMAYTFKKVYDTAKICFDTSLLYAIETKQVELELFLYNAYTVYYADQRNYRASLEYYDKAIRLAEKTEFYMRLSVIKYNAGVAYYNTNDFEKAEKYLLDAVEIMNTKSKRIDNSTMSAYYNMLSLLYKAQKRFDEALEAGQKALEYAQSANSKHDLARALLSCAMAYTKLKKEDKKAFEMINQALKLANEMGYEKLTAECLKDLALYYRSNGDYLMSEKYLLQALDLIYSEDIVDKKNLYNDLHETYVRLKKTEEALAAFNEYDSLMVALNNQDVQYAISDIETRYETEKKEREIERQQQVISRQSMQRTLLAAGITACLVILAMLWHMLRLRNRRNRILAEINLTKDKFFNIISHDLKNPAVSQRDTLQVLVRNASTWDANTLADYHGELLKSADGQVELIMNLLSWSKLQTGRMACTPQTFILSDLLPSLSLIRKMAENKHVSLNIQIPENKLINADSHILATVIRNLMTNAIKFTPSGGLVTLTVEPKAGRAYVYTVSDTGRGMTHEHIRKLFRLDNTHSQRGTAGEQGSGLGLIVCRELLEKHGSTLHVESEEGKGSRFWFEL
jgi:Signal transduction histidine kinase